jgi:hypothetical protein
MGGSHAVRHHRTLYGCSARCQGPPHSACARDIRSSVMATEPATPDKATLEAQARQLLEAARHRSGSTVEEMVKALGDLQPRGAETRRSWYDWQEKPETISLLTGIASMHLLGRAGTMELIFGRAEAEGADVPLADSGRLDALQKAVGEVVTEVAHLREQIQGLILPELEKQAQLMTKLLADVGAAEDLGTASTPEQAPTTRRASSG